MMYKPHILVADDETDIRLTLETALKAEGYRVSTATTGKEALELTKKEKPDLMLLDIMMPDMDGYEVCRAIKEDEATRNVIVVFASAMRKTRDKVEGLDIGADDYITKPFNIPELLAKLRVQFRIKDYQRKLEKLVDFARNSISLDYPALADMVKKNLDSFITADRYSILVTTEPPGALRILAHNHDDTEMNGLKLEISTSPIMSKARSGLRRILVNDFPGSPYVTKTPPDKYNDDYALCLPLKVGGRFLGILNLGGNSKGFFDKLDMNFAELTAQIISAALNNAGQMEQLRKLAITDGLTGLLNHRSFHEHLNLEFERSKRFGQPLSMIMADIDFFKQVNDTYGHIAGDEVLKEMATRLKLHLRAVDVVARYGGEEFSILLPRTNAEFAAMVAQRIRRDVESRPFETEKGPLEVTLSLGVSDNVKVPCKDAEDLLKKADEALYRAKDNGRNKVAVIEKAADR